jgi:hypothetical protein
MGIIVGVLLARSVFKARGTSRGFRGGNAYQLFPFQCGRELFCELANSDFLGNQLNFCAADMQARLKARDGVEIAIATAESSCASSTCRRIATKFLI